MATFANAFSYASNIIKGHKLKTSGSKRLDAFNTLLQTSSESSIKKSVAEMLSEYTNETDITRKKEIIQDIFILAFHKRSTSKKVNGVTICDGEGFKKLFYIYILELYNSFPDIVCEFATKGLFGIYGYWKDYLHIWEMVNQISMTNTEKYTKYNRLIQALSDGILNQRCIDIAIIRKFCYSRDGKFNFDFSTKNEFREFLTKHTFDKTISMVGKYCVRETSKFNKTCSWFAMCDGILTSAPHIKFMCGKLTNETITSKTLKKWRILNAKLNIILDVPEVKFCDGRWSELKIGEIPSVCFHKNTKALLNQKESDSCRYPESKDRMLCRENVIEHITSGKTINVSALLPNQIIGKIERLNTMSDINVKIMNHKWNLLLEHMRQGNGLSNGNILCCCDTSASMTWVGESPNRPFDIAVALTAFCSQMASEHYRNKIMTFSTIPNIIELSETSVQNRIQEIVSRGCYGSTNYEGLHTELIAFCSKFKVPESELPILVVFTDGEFNTMVKVSGSFDTAHKKITSLWNNAGYTKAPVICYWNLAPNSSGVQSSMREKDVILLQGSSPSNIRFVMYGETDEPKSERDTIDPYTIFRQVMDQPFFEPIRKIVY